jgi:ribosome recycling factor
MELNLEDLIKQEDSAMRESLDHLKKELTKIRAGKASPSMLDGLMVDYYDTPTPLAQVANLSTPDAKTIAIQPWEKSMLGNIEQAIFKANLGLTPMNDGEFVRITIPPLTEERRKDLVKQVKSAGEDAKISLRKTRQKMMDAVKKEVKDGYPEDEGKKKEGMIQGLLKKYSEAVDSMTESKEKDIMTV